LLPDSVDDYVAAHDRVRILDAAMDAIDCSALYAMHQGGGAPAYDPRMLCKVWVLGMSEGVRSSRKLEQRLRCDLRYMWLAEGAKPDYRTLSRFLHDAAEPMQALFGETVLLCKRVGLVLMEHVAVDGTRVRADVAGRNAYSKKRLSKELAALEAQIAGMLEEVAQQDAREDAVYGESSGNEMPAELRDAQTRLQLLQEARRSMEAAGASSIAISDPQSRMMQTTEGPRPAYNAQAAVDGANQVIVGAEVTQAPTDSAQLPAMLEQAQANTGETPVQASADAGYWNSDSIVRAQAQGIDVYVPVTGTRHDPTAGYTYQSESDEYVTPTGEVLRYGWTSVKRPGAVYRLYRCHETGLQHWIRDDGGLSRRMRDKLRTPEGRAVYRLRQQIVEPVFGHLKTAFGLRRFRARGLRAARTEFLLACIAHNLGKITASGRCVAA
jgi:transposase